MNTPSIGMALGRGRGVVAWPSADRATRRHPDGTGAAGQAESFTFDAGALAAGDERELAAVLRAVPRAVPRAERTAQLLHVALGSPWTSPRIVTLPRMREHEALEVLRRDAARHFPTVRDEPVIAARALGRGAWLASDADAVVLDAVARAARAAGFGGARILPAVGAWAHAAPNATQLAFVVDDEATVLSAERGVLTALRRCRPADLPVSITLSDADALAAAARHAPAMREHELVSPRLRAARGARAARWSRWFATAGAAMLLGAAAVLLWAPRHRLAQIEARRVTLEAEIAPFRAARDSLQRVQDALASITRSRVGSSSWSDRLSALSAALPPTAYLTSIHGSGDSASMTGRATDLAPILEQLRRTAGARDVRVTSTAVDAEGGAAFEAIFWFRPRGAR